MPSTIDKIFGPMEEKLGKGNKPKIGYYENLDLREGEQMDTKNPDVIGGGVGYDIQDKKKFLYVEGKRGPINANIETKSKDEYSGSFDYDVDENTKIGIKANKDDYSKSVSIGFNKKFNKGGFIAKGCGKVMNDRRKVTKMY